MSEINQNIDVKTSLQTTITLSPQMKQSLDILQMQVLELNQEISTFLETNPLLEIEENNDSDDDNNEDFDNNIDEKDENDPSEDDILSQISSDEWDEYIGYEKMDDISYKTTNDEDVYDLEKFATHTETLYDHLMYQLKISVHDPKMLKICEYIIGNLSDEGYFKEDVKECAKILKCSEKKINDAIKIIQEFTPYGVCARNLEECILIQLKELGMPRAYLNATKKILTDYKKELSIFKYEEIAAELDIELRDVKRILEAIRKTDPKPGMSYSGTNANFITPDVFIVPNGENFDIIINKEGIPNLKINHYYAKMLHDGSVDDEAKAYVKEKMRAATAFLYAVNKRDSTLAKVVNIIIQFQGDFLRYGGVERLKPFKLQDVADIIGANESTISRTTAGKYAMTEHGLIELKLFFSRSIENESGQTSVKYIKKLLQEIVASETDTVFYTDYQIVNILAEKGIKLARRTITKYREELKIPTMSERKRLRR